MKSDTLYISDKNLPDITQHNYYQKWLAAKATIDSSKPGIKHIDITHDDWCAIFKGKYCNCNPDVKVRVES